MLDRLISMLDRLICYFRGHRYCDWAPNAKSFWMCGDEKRWCQRCGHFDYRWNFNKYVAVGSTVRINLPQRWTIRTVLTDRSLLEKAAVLAGLPGNPDLPPAIEP